MGDLENNTVIQVRKGKQQNSSGEKIVVKEKTPMHFRHYR